MVLMHSQEKAIKTKLRKSISNYLKLKGFSLVKRTIKVEGSEITSFNRPAGKLLIDCIDVDLVSLDEDEETDVVLDCNISIGVALASLVDGVKGNVRECDSDVGTMLKIEMGTDELGWKLTESNYDSVIAEIIDGLESVGIPWFSRFTSLPEVLKSLDCEYLTDFEHRWKNRTHRTDDTPTEILSFLESDFTPYRLAILLRRYFKSVNERALAQEIERWEQSIHDGYPKKVSSIKDRPN
jgi:hypothetical protein